MAEHSCHRRSSAKCEEYDYLDEQLRALSPASLDALAKAARHLEQDPGMSFVQLKSRIAAP